MIFMLKSDIDKIKQCLNPRRSLLLKKFQQSGQQLIEAKLKIRNEG